MANDRYQDRDRDWPADREQNRGMFGYEGEGYLRGGDNDAYRTGFSGGYNRGGEFNSPPSRHRDFDRGSAERGWNIGAGSDRGAQPQSYRGRGPKNYQRSDDRIHEDVCERLAMDHDVDASDVEVHVAEGVVTLNGTVNERHAKRLAEDICESVRGVKDVQNNLRVNR
jgi:osmotically-inducible protein OsmY